MAIEGAALVEGKWCLIYFKLELQSKGKKLRACILAFYYQIAFAEA